MGMGMKAGQGLFYEAARTGDFPGMVELMKKYVKKRGAWIDSVLLNDPSVPAKPKISSSGAQDFPSNDLRFHASGYKGANAFSACKWRIAEIMPRNIEPKPWPPSQGPLEIDALWESAELNEEESTVSIPAGVAKPGHTYRVRARMKDATGRWSHWSEPVEFVPK
jgi:hypothetical protein